jgi:hypothetical protein
MYTIYHIFGKKIGCTQNYPGRCYEQGYKDSEFEVIELISEGCGPKFAGDQEQFWARYYGYGGQPHYFDTLMRDKSRDWAWNKLSSKERFNRSRRQWGWDKMSPEERSKELSQRAKHPNHPNNRTITCPNCGETGQMTSTLRFHFDKCWALPIFSANNTACE